jgi:hypothetical protein
MSREHEVVGLAFDDEDYEKCTSASKQEPAFDFYLNRSGPQMRFGVSLGIRSGKGSIWV